MEDDDDDVGGDFLITFVVFMMDYSKPFIIIHIL